MKEITTLIFTILLSTLFLVIGKVLHIDVGSMALGVACYLFVSRYTER